MEAANQIVRGVCFAGSRVWHRLLTTTRRRMLRWMLRAKRGSNEDWISYLRRATHEGEEKAAQAGARDWRAAQISRKWHFARATAGKEDDRWSTRLLDWRLWFRECPSRSVGHPVARWEDVFVKAAGSDWVKEAKDETLWRALTLAYEESIT